MTTPLISGVLLQCCHDTTAGNQTRWNQLPTMVTSNCLLSHSGEEPGNEAILSDLNVIRLCEQVDSVADYICSYIVSSVPCLAMILYTLT